MAKHIFSPESKRSNLKFAMGDHTSVAASDTVDTGLREVYGVVVSMAADPSDDLVSVTADKSATAGSITVKTWKNTSGSDPTPAAATTFAKKVHWIAWGI